MDEKALDEKLSDEKWTHDEICMCVCMCAYDVEKTYYSQNTEGMNFPVRKSRYMFRNTLLVAMTYWVIIHVCSCNDFYDYWKKLLLWFSWIAYTSHFRAYTQRNHLLCLTFHDLFIHIYMIHFSGLVDRIIHSITTYECRHTPDAYETVTKFKLHSRLSPTFTPIWKLAFPEFWIL